MAWSATGLLRDLPPAVVLADTPPLIHLAALDQLDLLFEFGRVVIVDVVRDETCFDLSKPFAGPIARWIEARVGEGSNRKLDIAVTDFGEAYRLALRSGLRPPRNAGERAIVDWLAETVLDEATPALIVYENGKVPQMLRREGLPTDVFVVSTRYFLGLAQDRGLVADADALWAKLDMLDIRANPVSEAVLIEGTKP